jgi:hypothetical protein
LVALALPLLFAFLAAIYDPLAVALQIVGAFLVCLKLLLRELISCHGLVVESI